jgi:hypothetical protein
VTPQQRAQALQELKGNRTWEQFMHDVNSCGQVHDTTRNTVHVWMTLRRPPPDAVDTLIEHLNKLKNAIVFPIVAAVPDWISVLIPVEFLTWNAREENPTFPFECSTRNKIALTKHKFDSGGLALKRLDDGGADIAFAARAFQKNPWDYPNCLRVASVIASPIRASATFLPESLADFGRKKVGVPPRSKVGDELRRLCVDKGLNELPVIKEFEEPKSYAAEIESGKTRCFGWFLPLD